MSSQVDEQRIAELLNRPYRKVIRGEPVEGYLAEAPELPGCLTAGATESEALENLHEAMAVWLESALAHGEAIPAPEPGRSRQPSAVSRQPSAVSSQDGDGEAESRWLRAESRWLRAES